MKATSTNKTVCTDLVKSCYVLKHISPTLWNNITKITEQCNNMLDTFWIAQQMMNEEKVINS